MLHVDLDQFIAAVEVLRHPELRGRPVVVGGDGDPTKRGVVSTASYEAREHGVHSGLPLRTAARRLPDAVFLPVDREAYEEVSAVVMDVLRASGAVLEVLGWDEAFLGVDTDDPEAFARSLAAGVRAATQLDCSVGIGENKLQAKMATGFGKPAGVFRLTSANWFGVLGAQPTDALWGIGAKTARKLAGLGIRTVSDLASADPDAAGRGVRPDDGARGWSSWAAASATRTWTIRRTWPAGTARRRRSSAISRTGRTSRLRWRGLPGCSPPTWPVSPGPRYGSWSRYGTRRSSPRRTG